MITLTKKSVVQAINFAITILVAIFIGMALQTALFLVNTDQSTSSFLLFTAQTMALLALFVLLQFVLKTVFGKEILKPECAECGNKMRILYQWAKGEYEMSAPNQLFIKKELFRELTKKIQQYL